MSSLDYMVAINQKHYEDARTLFNEYANSLNFNLEFQQFSREISSIDQMYGSPAGCLMIVYDGANAIACAAYRKLDSEICELKRMYVRPEYRSLKIGKELLILLIDKAKANGYAYMRLDTVKNMVSARSLYQKNGFYEIAPYYLNPNEGVVYMEKQL